MEYFRRKVIYYWWKKALTMIRAWFQSEFKRSCSIDDIIKNAQKEDFDKEIIEMIEWLRE